MATDDTTTVRVFDDDVDRLDALNRRKESYAETFQRILDEHEDRADVQSSN